MVAERLFFVSMRGVVCRQRKEMCKERRSTEQRKMCCNVGFTHHFTLILFCSVDYQRSVLTESSDIIQIVEILIPVAIFSSAFSTNITIIHEACSNIYVTSFQLRSNFEGIVKYINLYFITTATALIWKSFNAA